ncbi:MAG TPA: hypothetical protein VHS13_01535 [Edaphobacter sp.]|jgi:hypothetical protein|nr:hypothetical protein [Edaphobacter sp.]
MIGEIRDEPNLTTAEIANPATPRSQFQKTGSNTTTDVIDQPQDIEVNRDERNRVEVDRDAETRRGTAAIGTVEGTRDLVQDQTLKKDQPGQLFPENELNEFRARWDKAQIRFVDEPRAAVEQADGLIATVVKRIAEQFAAERAELEHQWDRGDNVSTEDLRQALRRYHSFFDRLLAF